MTEAAPSLEKTEVSPRPEAVECNRGHWNDPYPYDGKCTSCGVYLPSNPDVLTSETASEYRRNQAQVGKSREEIAHSVLEDEGVKWDDATEGMRQLALLFAKSKNVKTYELILQQIGVLKARPKPGEEVTEIRHELSLTASNVADLQRSLSDLEGMTSDWRG